MVRTLGVRAAQAHIWRDNLGENALTLIVGAHAHAKDDWHTIRCGAIGDQRQDVLPPDGNALIALHKLRTHLGSPAEIEASKAWLRSQGLTGLFKSRCCR